MHSGEPKDHEVCAQDDRRLIVSQLLREMAIFPAARTVFAVIGIYACGLSGVSW